MEFGILGPLAVWREGRELPLGGAKQRAVLGVLLLRRNELVPLGQLVDELWGEQPPPTAVKALRVYVSQLRKLLGDGVLETRPGGYLLRVEPHELDLERFADFVDEGRRLLAAGAAAEAGTALRSALALWRGPAFADLQYEAFARSEIARLDELRLAALEQRLEADLALGRHGAVVAELEAVVHEQPLREGVRRLLMLALYRCGRQADALAAYQAGRTALVEELGLDPSPALQQLEQAILRQDPSLDVAVQPAPTAPPEPQARDDWTIEERKTVTVLVCEVDAEHLDPEALRHDMSQFFDRAAPVFERHGGTLERFIGDELMSVFGVPAVHEDDALRAVRAAIALREAVADLSVEVRIGVSTGEVLAAGNGFISGDALGVGKRLVQAAAPGEILLGEPTYRLVAHAVTASQLATLELKGNRTTLGFRLESVDSLATSVPHRDSTPFIGRRHELKLLEDAFASVVRRRGCALFTLLGVAGVGKSRLAREFLAGVDARVVTGRYLSYGEGITYSPVIEVVKQLDADTTVAPPIAALLGESDVPTTPHEIAWAVRKLLEASAAERPLVVVFEDIHWGEPTFLDLVEHVVELSRGAPILVLCVARPELLDRRAGWGGGKVNATTATLEPLDPGETDELIGRLLGGVKLEPALGARIRAAADGIPLFVEEMLAMMRESGGGDVVVPPTIRALLAARVDQLDPRERSVLERGSVEGQVFHSAAVEALAHEPESVDRELSALVRKELVRPDRPQVQIGEAYRFRHVLIRDAVYDALPKATRATLHERFAGWLDEHGAGLVERDEILGYHLEQACRYRTELSPADDETRALGERGARHLAGAGRRAAERGDFPASADLLERALALGIVDPRECARLRVELGYALTESGRRPEAEAVLAETIEAANALGERGVAAYALVRRVALQEANPQLDDDHVQAICEQAIETLTELGDERGLALARRYLAISIGRRGRLGAACAELERALAHAEACGDREMRREVITSLSFALCIGPTPVADATRRCEELLRSAGDDRLLEATIERRLGLLYAMAGRSEEALELVSRSGLVLDELSQLSIERFRWLAARARELAGDRAGAEHELTGRWLAFGSERVSVRALEAAAHLAEFYCDEGRWGEAEGLLAYGRDVSLVGYRAAAAIRLAVEARLAAHRGRPAAAVELAERAVAVADLSDNLNLRARMWLALAEVQRANGRTAESEAAIAMTLELYEQKGNVADAERLRAPAAV